MSVSSFSPILSGPTAFYNQDNYLVQTRVDLSQAGTLPVTYRWDTEHKIIRIAKEIFSKIILPAGAYNAIGALLGITTLSISSIIIPVAIYNFLYLVAGILILPASHPPLFKQPKNLAKIIRSNIQLEEEISMKFKRLTLEVDGYKIDAMIMGRPSTLNNGRWVLASNGNGEFYEYKPQHEDFTQILEQVKGNALIFNYPGVGASSGFPNRNAMTKAYRAMLTFLEDTKNGIGAKEIIGYGLSIGGGVQGDALRTHELKRNVKYVFVKDRTFSDLSAIVSDITLRVLGLLVKVLGWNLDSVESSKKLRAPEIILQTASGHSYETLTAPSGIEKIEGDGVITKRASLAKVLLQDPLCPKVNKTFIGIPEFHNDPLSDIPFLTNKINELLDPQASV